MLRSTSSGWRQRLTHAALLTSAPCPAPKCALRRSALIAPLFQPAVRRLSSFSDSEADEIWREMQALKKQEQQGKPQSLQRQLRQHLQQPQLHTPATADSADSDTLTADDDTLTATHSTLIHAPSAATSPSSHPPPAFRPSGGPSVDAILRLRRTNRKVDTDDISSRFQKAMEYKRMRAEQKEAGKGTKAGQS